MVLTASKRLPTHTHTDTGTNSRAPSSMSKESHMSIGQMSSSLQQATLLLEIAATNKALSAAGLPALGPTLTSQCVNGSTVGTGKTSTATTNEDGDNARDGTHTVVALLEHLRSVAAASLSLHNNSNAVRAAAESQARRQARASRSQALEVERLRKLCETRDAELRVLERKCAISDSYLAEARTRCRNLEAEIIQVRKDFHAGTSMARKSNPSIRSSNLRRSESTASMHSTHSPVRKPSSVTISPPSDPSPQQNAPPAPISESEIMRRAAEIAQKHAQAYRHDASSLAAAQVAVVHATEAAELELEESVLACPPKGNARLKNVAESNLSSGDVPDLNLVAGGTSVGSIQRPSSASSVVVEEEVPYASAVADWAFGPGSTKAQLRQRRFARTVTSSNATLVEGANYEKGTELSSHDDVDGVDE
ncbi:hypothetical protein BJ741DRAFT_609380 [Chytriomyces cf. hyalinus JEL632]|nr:hypothetical protein BJ741DRAFT_609380 [Chytriomyces cf. hyalinus JEL632]